MTSAMRFSARAALGANADTSAASPSSATASLRILPMTPPLRREAAPGQTPVQSNGTERNVNKRLRVREGVNSKAAAKFAGKELSGARRRTQHEADFESVTDRLPRSSRHRVTTRLRQPEPRGGEALDETPTATMVVTLTPFPHMPKVRPGDDLSGLLIAACEQSALSPAEDRKSVV